MRDKLLTLDKALGLVLILALVVGGCGPTAKKPSPKPAAQSPSPKKTEKEDKPVEKQATWQKVASFSGTGMQETPNFTVTSNAWRVTVTGKSPDPASASFAGYVHAKNDDPESPDDYGQIEGQGVGPTSADFYTSGTYFIHMHAENMEWTVTVEELK